MNSIALQNESSGLSALELRDAVRRSLVGRGPMKKVLLIPPDITRLNSGAGILAAMYFEELEPQCRVELLPALGSHVPMTREEQISFFGPQIPQDRFLVHNWRTGVVKLGEVPREFVHRVSDGLIDEAIDVELSDIVVNGGWDLIISIGQVVPHEVVGMSNYSKNLFVGCGGNSMINKSHMLGAFYGAERVMGRDHSPVRRVFDYAEQNFIGDLPLMYALTVTSQIDGRTAINGLYIGRSRSLFEQAVALSQKLNICFVEKPIDTCVVWMDPEEFRSTWLSNKAVYRSRMALNAGARLIVLAPGVDKFGEDPENDRLIRKFGYCGREKVLELCKTEPELAANLSVAAHLIHGSSDGKFSITYAAPKLGREQVESVCFQYGDIDALMRLYDPEKLAEGWNTMPGGEEIYFIKNPALGLWALRSQF